MGAFPHHRNGFPGQHELPEINRYPFHPSEQDMIPAADIQDQELAIRAERSRIDHPAVCRRSHLGARTGSDR